MKKNYLIYLALYLALILIPLFITACAGGGFLTRSSSGSSYSPNGIQIKFLQPNQIFTIDEGERITVLLELTNFAQCDAIGKICMDDGALSDAFGGFSKRRDCQELNIPAALEKNGKLDYEIDKKQFESQPYQNLFTDTNINLNAIANYKCDILMSTRVCAASLLDETSKCKSFETITGSSLGARAAPVTLAKIEKEVSTQESGLKLKTKLTFRKMSKGLVRDEDGNTLVRLEVDYSGVSMDCKDRDYNNGVLTWKPANEPEKVINCEILLSNQETNDPLNIHLNYDYEISEETGPIRIRNKEA